MAGSISKLPSGKWRARYRDEEKKQHAAHFDTKTQAQTWLDDETAKKVNGTWVDPTLGKQTFGDYVDEWMKTKVGVSDRTRINVEGRIQNYGKPFFEKMPISSVRPMHARGFVADLVGRGLAPATVKAIVLTTGQVFAQAVTDGMIARSPFAGIELPPERHREEMHFLNADQVNVLANALENDRYRTAIYVAGYGGLRAGELWALRPARVNVLARSMDVVESLSEIRGQVSTGPTKTGKMRTITVPRFLAEMIGEHIGKYPSTEFLFTAAEGGPVRHRNFMRRHFKPAVEAATGVPDGLRFHDLRHSCAELLVANGRHLEEVKDYLGHSSIRVTSDRYGHLFPKARAELADSLDATYRSSAENVEDSLRTDAEIVALPGVAEAAE